ncbi:MAG: hydroxymethylbilane synthase [Parachlamydiaceae bacterium]
MMYINDMLFISVGSRGSPLAKAQVEEIKDELKAFIPSIDFDCLFVDSTGDQDQVTSLRTLGKTDFFTKEIDELLLSGACRIAIHSAKDLPSPLPDGLSIVALTRGLDPSDTLVLKEGVSVDTLPASPVIATSSERREEAVRLLIPDAVFIDIRGQIRQRLSKLNDGTANGVVLAESALIRLGLTYLNRLKLPGPTTPLQGQLAVMARSDDMEMKELFACIDNRLGVCCP